MKRFEEERHIAEKRIKLAEAKNRLYAFSTPKEKLSPGRFRKQHPMDCGKPRCGVCARHKRFGHQPTYQELRQMEKEKYV